MLVSVAPSPSLSPRLCLRVTAKKVHPSFDADLSSMLSNLRSSQAEKKRASPFGFAHRPSPKLCVGGDSEERNWRCGIKVPVCSLIAASPSGRIQNAIVKSPLLSSASRVNARIAVEFSMQSSSTASANASQSRRSSLLPRRSSVPPSALKLWYHSEDSTASGTPSAIHSWHSRTRSSLLCMSSRHSDPDVDCRPGSMRLMPDQL
mmetsp:Transcript_3665/g.7580  ORF Transcript_3665/g.7580 Transcript_3665/m.7580 type:complete len:205 (-) Transcript_3665:1146-1760(-)